MKVVCLGTQRSSGISQVNGNPSWVFPDPPGTQNTCIWWDPVTSPIRVSRTAGGSSGDPSGAGFSIRTRSSSPSRLR